MAGNYTVPRFPTAGGPIRRGWGDSVVKAIRQLVPVQVPGMLISRGTYGTRLTPVGASESVTEYSETSGSATLPFDVRWYDFGKDAGGKSKGGEWQIYLPIGCLSVAQSGETMTYLPMNDKAVDADGSVMADWYKVDAAETVTYADFTVVGKDDDRRVAVTRTVYLNMKPWPRVRVSCDPTDFNPVGWSVPVASIRTTEYSDGNEETEHESVRLTEGTAIAKERDVSSAFAVKYEITDTDIVDKNATPTVRLVNETLFLGRLQATAAPATDITGWNDVWIRVNHASEDFSAEIAHDLTGADARSDDNKTVCKIYELDGGVVTVDNRANIPVFDFYTSPATTRTDE